ncbi:MAG: DUF4143 domain-containing protein, partial [Coriobacteriales bacterium]|nr:DUF4143 domain-containing protein [Coriobacteriales bacterium]
PKQLSRESKKFFYSQIQKGARGRDYELALLWLSDCGIIHRVARVASPEIPLKFFEDTGSFKVFLSDVGLLSYLCGASQQHIVAGAELLKEYRGALAEQFVLQELVAQTPWTPYYWTSHSGSAEVDFLVQGAKGGIPIEVKAGINLKAKSLKVFMEKYGSALALRLSLAEHKTSQLPYKDGTTGSIVDVPLYACATFTAVADALCPPTAATQELDTWALSSVPKNPHPVPQHQTTTCNEA